MTDAGRAILLGLAVSVVLWGLLLTGVYQVVEWVRALIAG